jgi:50S ribosomal subunit-associated GTPase HflX
VEFVQSRDPRQAARVILVATKVDKIAKSKRNAALKKLAARHDGLMLPVSALTGEGTERLWKALRRAACGSRGRLRSPDAVTNLENGCSCDPRDHLPIMREFFE